MQERSIKSSTTRLRNSSFPETAEAWWACEAAPPPILHAAVSAAVPHLQLFISQFIFRSIQLVHRCVRICVCVYFSSFSYKSVKKNMKCAQAESWSQYETRTEKRTKTQLKIFDYHIKYNR